MRNFTKSDEENVRNFIRSLGFSSCVIVGNVRDDANGAISLYVNTSRAEDIFVMTVFIIEHIRKRFGMTIKEVFTELVSAYKSCVLGDEEE